MYAISKFAELIGITPHPLRVWHKEGKLIPGIITKGGTRYYTEFLLFMFFLVGFMN